MANPLSFTFYTTPSLADLRAQFYTTAGANSGSAIDTGFIEVGTNGMYNFFGDPGDNFTGGVKFYSNADASNILAIRDISPKEVENNDVKASTLATQTSVNLLPSAASIVTAIMAYAVETGHNMDTVLKALYAVIRGGYLADSPTDPTETIYYAPDGVTARVTHELTSTTREPV